MHCGDGCKTTLGVRRADNGMEIVRGDNRDKSGINGDFLCIKGRYAFDVVQSRRAHQGASGPQERQTGSGLVGRRRYRLVASKFAKSRSTAKAIGVIGSNRITNEEAYLLQKFARAGARHEQHRPPPHG